MRVGNYLLAPAETNAVIVDYVSQHLRAIMDMPDVRTRLSDLSIEPIFGGSEEAQERLVADRERWGDVAAAVGMARN
jgi:tripartite-type tricarboxylate transporter receptor subunit TctC